MYGTENIGSITGIDLATLIASASNNKCIGALTVSELQDIIADIPVSVPTGFIYIQLAGQDVPSDLYGGTWENTIRLRRPVKK